MAVSLLVTDRGAAASTEVLVPASVDYPKGSSIIVSIGFRPGSDADPLHYFVEVAIGGATTRLTKDIMSWAANNSGIAIYSIHDIAAAVTAGTNIRIRMGDTANKVSAFVMNFGGLGAATLDQLSVNPAQDVNAPSGSVYTSNATPTTTQANELLVGGVILHTTDVTALTPSTGWTSAGTPISTSGGSAGSNAMSWAQFHEVTATGQFTSNPSRGTHNYRSAIATYKIAAGAAPAPAPSPTGNFLAFF